MPKYRELRVQHGYTQEYVAEAIGVSMITYIRYENGERQFKVPELLALAQLYHVSVDYILGLTESPVVITDTKKDPSPEDQEQALRTSAAALDGKPTLALTEEDRRWLREYVDTAVDRALDKRGTPCDSPAGSQDHTDP